MVRFEMAIDIHDSKMREKALYESETRLAAITTAANDAIISIDSSGNITFWNPAAEKLFGYSFEEIQNMNVHTLLAPHHYREQYSKAFSHFKDTGEGDAVNNTVEITARKKEGT